ncbi:MFS transporter, partial [Lacticaseibacillus paracasei]|nr:MFS transporter [Lacticaseibacillus paracasei]
MQIKYNVIPFLSTTQVAFGIRLYTLLLGHMSITCTLQKVIANAMLGRSLYNQSMQKGSFETTTEEIQILEKDISIIKTGDVVLSQKICIINEAIDELGFTWFHFKLFCIAGFGYSVDSQMMIVQSSVKSYVDGQMKGGGYPIATEIFYAGLLTGSIVFGFGADLIGRKLAFNMSLLLSSAFGFFIGGTSSYAMYCIFLFLSTLAAGGNLATDVAVFLEFLPSKYQYLNTTMAAWWGVGQTIANLIAWRFLPSYSCDDPTSPDCTSRLNRGWRYCWYVNSGIVMG